MKQQKSAFQKAKDNAKNQKRYAAKKNADKEEIRKMKERDTDASGKDVG